MYGRSRVPRPPAKITACFILDLNRLPVAFGDIEISDPNVRILPENSLVIPDNELPSEVRKPSFLCGLAKPIERDPVIHAA